MSDFRFINGIRAYGFSSTDELVSALVDKNAIGVALNADKLNYADDELRALVNDNIGYCDGVGAVWALRRKGLKGATKIAGVELWLEVIKRYPASRYWLIGAEEEVIEGVVERLKTEFPEIRIVGWHNGFFDKQEWKELAKKIADDAPDFVFAAMGSPRQERFLSDVHTLLQSPMLGLGGSFNVYTGKVKRAPKWIRSLALEAPYRWFTAGVNWKRRWEAIKFIFKIVFNRL